MPWTMPGRWRIELTLSDPEGMGQTPPPLIIVSGAPGSGKSTLAETLADHLGLPLLARDSLKERIADALDPAADTSEGVPAADSAAIGRAAYEILFAVADQLLDARVGVIVESNFRRGLSEAYLRPHVAKAAAVLVHCEAPPDLIVARFAGRAGSAGRHRVHPDLDRLDTLVEELATGRFEPLELGIATIRVDTSAGYQPALPDIVDGIRRVIGPG
jgi:predicted kinase